MASGDGGQETNIANGGEYVITISKEVGEIRSDERIHMGAAIEKSVTAALASETNPINQLATERETRSKEREIGNSLWNTLKEIIITLAAFFIYFISFLGSFQQSSHDHFRFVVVAFLVAVIWIFTVLLVVIWWLELNVIKVEISTLEGGGGEYPPQWHWHLCRTLVVILGIFVTVFSVYFAYILYSQWLSGSSPAPSPSALPTFQLPSTVPVATQYYGFQ